MHLIAPLSNIILMTIPYFQDEDNKRKVMFEIENMTTVEVKIDDTIVKASMKSLATLIKTDYMRVEIYATILTFFRSFNNDTMIDVYSDELSKMKVDVNIKSDKWISGFLSAIYTVAVSNAHLENNEVALTESIRPAVEYIEKHGYEVILRNRQ
jgi:hypothetical protein